MAFLRAAVPNLSQENWGSDNVFAEPKSEPSLTLPRQVRFIAIGLDSKNNQTNMMPASPSFYVVTMSGLAGVDRISMSERSMLMRSSQIESWNVPYGC